jgi:hypothetical protein
MRMMHVGRPLGGELLGATVFEMEAGVPGIYHFHTATGNGRDPRRDADGAHPEWGSGSRRRRRCSRAARRRARFQRIRSRVASRSSRACATRT